MLKHLLLNNKWDKPGGYRELLIVAFPLIMTMATHSLQQYIDRVFLARYGTNEIAAALPGGILHFTLLTFFMGTAFYASTFAAQYYGAKRFREIGPMLWQGVYIAIPATLVQFLAWPIVPIIFKYANHDPAVQVLEVTYFRLLAFTALPAIACGAFAGLYNSRGKTWTIMWINFIGTAVNIVFNYLLIFGKYGFPEMGIKGAAIGTIISAWFMLGIYIYVFWQKKYNEKYATRDGWRFNFPLFKRLLKYGFPSGLQFFLDIMGFGLFILVVGSLGKIEQAATNITFNTNMLAFMPVVGMGTAVSILVGQYIGRKDPDIAEQSTYNGLKLSLLYMLLIAAAYIFSPMLFIEPMRSSSNNMEEFNQMAGMATVLLRYVAIYCLFDPFVIIFSSALKGAGDMKFLMIISGIFPITFMVLPTWASLKFFNGRLHSAFIIITVYIFLFGMAFWLRFLTAKWKKMSLIDEPITQEVPPAPTLEG